jgi:two-component system NarL family sensor kinase
MLVRPPPPRAEAGRNRTVGRAVAQFMLVGLVAVAVFGVVSLLVLRELGHRQAVRDARAFAVLAGQGIVEPALTYGVLENDPAAIRRLDQIVQERVLGERVMRVKIWTRQGRIVYSDEPRLIGSSYRLGEDEQAVFRSGAVQAELSDLARPENRFERGQGGVYEVYARVRAQDGTPLMFETYQRASSLVASGRDVWRPFAIPLLVSLLLLWLVQVPLAWRLARSLQRSQRESETLLLRAVESSANERRRIAADLHDGVVQDLAGMSYSLNAVGDRISSQVAPEVTAALRDAAARARSAVRQLRTLLVEIHPPNLRSAGLRAALADLLAPLLPNGITTDLLFPEELQVGPEAEQMIFRAVAEAIRNVQRHSRATHATVSIAAGDEYVRVEVADDGIGFSPVERHRRSLEGHLGLTLLEGLVERHGGSLEITSAPGRGTSFVLEVPNR